MNLNTYVNEIMDIATANDVSWDVGADMFLANVRNSGDETLPHYPGAFVDYAALKPELDAMSPEDVATMKNNFRVWYRAHEDAIRKARG